MAATTRTAVENSYYYFSLYFFPCFVVFFFFCPRSNLRGCILCKQTAAAELSKRSSRRSVTVPPNAAIPSVAHTASTSTCLYQFGTSATNSTNGPPDNRNNYSDIIITITTLNYCRSCLRVRNHSRRRPHRPTDRRSPPVPH